MMWIPRLLYWIFLIWLGLFAPPWAFGLTYIGVMAYFGVGVLFVLLADVGPRQWRHDGTDGDTVFSVLLLWPVLLVLLVPYWTNPRFRRQVHLWENGR